MPPKPVEQWMSPDVGKTVSEDIPDLKSPEIMKQVAREYCAVRHDRKLSYPTGTSHTRRQGISVKAGGVDAMYRDIRILFHDFFVKFHKGGIMNCIFYHSLFFA